MLESTRKFVSERAKHCCEYCFSQEQYCPDSFCVEHILPGSKGGTDDFFNLAWSCQGCNGRKYNHHSAIDSWSGQFAPLYNPRTDDWGKHFQWDEDFLLIIGISPTGRATVERLKLNRAGVVNLRHALIATDEHPPF